LSEVSVVLHGPWYRTMAHFCVLDY
jgi:hypothetical protein